MNKNEPKTNRYWINKALEMAPPHTALSATVKAWQLLTGYGGVARNKSAAEGLYRIACMEYLGRYPFTFSDLEELTDWHIAAFIEGELEVLEEMEDDSSIDKFISSLKNNDA